MNKQLLHPEIIKILHGIWYRSRFLVLYIIIGFLSLLLELAVRSQLQFLGIHVYLATAISLIIGILFAFFGNTYFNFQIPPARRNRALIYFVSISLISGALQWCVAQVLGEVLLNYAQERLLFSGSLFIIAYVVHRRFTFRDFKRVGVAIYANGLEDLKGIHEKIGQYPDFIHVDIVDSSFLPEAEDTEAYRMETIRAFWPNREIHTHIMSKTPSRWLSEVLPFSDIVYVHWECEEQIEAIIKQVQKAEKKAGVAITMGTSPDKVQRVLEFADAVLVLTISEPGKSGQQFDMGGLEYIDMLNEMPLRDRIRICVDGGVNEKIVPLLHVEDVVSGSSVLNHSKPKHQIMCLQNVGRYGLK